MLNPKTLIFIISASLFFTACSQTAPQIQVQPAPVKENNTTKRYRAVPPPPKKKIELKEVQDDNYSPEYMYPDDKYKKDKLTEKSANTQDIIEAQTPSMSREECIAMIGQEKFDKYTEMFGNEAASLKRCTLLKSMQES